MHPQHIAVAPAKAIVAAAPAIAVGHAGYGLGGHLGGLGYAGLGGHYGHY